MKKIVFPFFIILISSYLYCEDVDIAKTYLRDAQNSYNTKQVSITKQYLDKSFGFSERLPEYYYFSNLILSDDQSDLSIKRNNSDKILSNLTNLFLIDEYDFLTQTAKIYEQTHEYKKSYESYLKLFQIEGKDLKNDYINCLKMLFNSNIQDKIPEIIIKAKQNYEIIDLYYYNLLYKIKFTKLPIADFSRDLNILISNNFSETKILYLKALYSPKVYNEYISLKGKIDPSYKKRIIFTILSRPQNLSGSEILKLSTDWIEAQGLIDSRTNILLKNSTFVKLIEPDKALKQQYFNYSGTRIKDVDEDGYWEENDLYKNNILIEKITDSNQDGVYETSFKYGFDGKIKEFIKYKNLSDYVKYNFNQIDISLVSADYYENKKLVKKDNLLKSSLYIKSNDYSVLNENFINKYIDTVETFDGGHKITKMNQGQIQYEYVDADNNGIFEYKNIYKNNIQVETLKDLNGNGIYEIKEVYKNGKLSEIFCKTDENSANFDYIEKNTGDGIEKYWDNNNDGIYELLIKELNNGTTYKMFDFDYNGKYDYVYELKGKIPVKLYEIKNEKWIIIKYLNEKSEHKLNNWIIISIKETEKIIIPDSINIKDKESVSGIFSFMGKRNFFENGIIKSDSFNYKLFLLNDQIYLLDF
jgi:hypothetical protein